MVTRCARTSKALPGFGEMKVKALGSVLAKRFGVEAAATSCRGTRRSATSTRRRRWPTTRPRSARHKAEWSKAQEAQAAQAASE